MKEHSVKVRSVEEIRRDFPALERIEAGRPAAFFDGPGGTQVSRAVADAMVDYLLHHNANTHWEYATSAETDALLAGARAALGDFLGCTSDEVVFGANMTTLTFHLARALGRGCAAGDEVIVTRLDHQANVAPWKDMARERGLVVHEIPFDPSTGRLREDELLARLSPRTKVVAIGAASNALGTVTDVAPLAAAAREAGAFVFVDAVHFAPHERVDVRALGCDALGCSPYKFHGPHLGTLFVDQAHLEALDVPRLPCAGDDGGERFETGTLSHEAIVGAGTAVDHFASLVEAEPGATESTRTSRLDAAFAELHARGERQIARLWDGLEAIIGVRLYGPRPGTPRTSTLAFTLAGHDPAHVARTLSDRHGVFVSHGDFYASTVIEDLGLAPDGLVRAGTAMYTTDDEIDRLVAGVAELARA